MPASKHNKSKKCKPSPTDSEKLVKKTQDDGVINNPPKNSLTIQAAGKSKTL